MFIKKFRSLLMFFMLFSPADCAASQAIEVEADQIEELTSNEQDADRATDLKISGPIGYFSLESDSAIISYAIAAVLLVIGIRYAFNLRNGSTG